MDNNLQPTMTEEDIKKLESTLETIRKENEKLFPSNGEEDVVEQGEERLVNVTIDPTTGKEKIMNAEEVNIDEDTSVDDILDKDFDLEFDNSPISLEELKAYINTATDDPTLEEIKKSTNISAEDFTVLLDLANRLHNKEDIPSIFNKLPKSVQAIINKSMGPGYDNVFNANINGFRNDMAEMLLDQMVTDILVDRAKNTMNTGVEKIFDAAKTEIGDTLVGYTEERNKKYRQEIEEKVEDPEKKAKALEILDKIETTYKLEEFKEYCKKCKIRKIDVEKPESNKNYDIDRLLDKYKNNANFNIYNIYNAQLVLTRTINKDEQKYNSKQIRAFFIAFARYCMNFSPDNTLEHIFMFYTIYNVVLTDINTGDKAGVSNEFLANVKECINNLTTRNSFLE